MIKYTEVPEFDNEIDRQIKYLKIWESVPDTKREFISMGKHLVRHMLIVEERLAPKQPMDLVTLYSNIDSVLVYDRNSKSRHVYLIHRGNLRSMELYD